MLGHMKKFIDLKMGDITISMIIIYLSTVLSERLTQKYL